MLINIWLEYIIIQFLMSIIIDKALRKQALKRLTKRLSHSKIAKDTMGLCNLFIFVHDIRTISPSWIVLRANRPHPCMPDLPKHTRSFSVLWNHASVPKIQSENGWAKPINHHWRKRRFTCKWWRRSLKDENVWDSSTTYLREWDEQKNENKGAGDTV